MIRPLFAASLMLGLICSTSVAQDAAARRATRATRAQEKVILDRITQRLEWDKQLTGSTLRMEVEPGGAVVLKGSVQSQAAKLRAVDLVESTTGVTTVVDELAVVKDVKVIEPTKVTSTPDDIITVPSETRVISRP